MKSILNLSICLAIASFISASASAREASKEEAACLSAYHEIHDALAKDNVSGAKAAAQNCAQKATEAKSEAVAQHARELAKSDSLDKAREHFKALSAACIKMAEGVDGQYVFTCPMARADWLQTDKTQASNPYMGKKMPACGSLKKS